MRSLRGLRHPIIRMGTTGSMSSAGSVPARWRQSSEQERFWCRLERAPNWLLLLDYDGTLAPFHQDRMLATPYPGVIQRLQEFSSIPRGKLIVVSGRQVADLETLLSSAPRIEIWGSHGREHRLPNGEYRLIPLEDDERRAVEHFASGLTADGWGDQLERKPAAVAVHWRGLAPEDAAEVERSAYRHFATANPPASLEMLPFESGVELRSRARTKGQVVADLLAEEPADSFAAYLGDDWTDEDAFRALRGVGYGFLVKQEPRESFASFHLVPPDELLEFLDRWLIAVNKEAA